MKTLDITQAKNIAHAVAKDINPIDHREFFLIHSERVGAIATMLAEKMGIQNDLFTIAGRVHDIGYVEDFTNHADYAIPMLEKMGYEVDDILRDCILHHGTGKHPTTLEGKIFQIADKLSIFDKEIIQLILKHGTFPLQEADINFLTHMSQGAIRLLKEFVP